MYINKGLNVCNRQRATMLTVVILCMEMYRIIVRWCTYFENESFYWNHSCSVTVVDYSICYDIKKRTGLF